MDVDVDRYVGVMKDPPWATLLAFLEGDVPATPEPFATRLRDAGCTVAEYGGDDDDPPPWSLEVAHEGGSARIAPAARPGTFEPFGESGDLAAAVRRAGWALSFGRQLGDEPLGSFHDLLRIVLAAAPDALAYADLDAWRLHRPDAVREMVESAIPPAPTILFGVHAVHAGERDGASLWMHTHGLNRCGSIELDIVGVQRRDAHDLGNVLNVTATMMIERGVPPPGEPFAVAQTIALLWLPWEDGIDHVPRGALGGPADREDGDHVGARGLLFVPKRGLLGPRLKPLSVLRRALAADPVFWVSAHETRRMAALAKQEFDRFRRLHDRFGAEERGWMFVVKIGYPVDEGESSESEHLWFHVHAIEEGRVDATLINQPRMIASLREGGRDWRPLDRMSDWTIYSQHGTFGADSVGELERLIG